MAKVEFNPSVSFKSNPQTEPSNLIERAELLKGITPEQKEDILYLAEELKKIDSKTPKAKKSFKENTKEGIANIWKFFSVAGTLAYAAAKGTLYGIASSTALLLGAIALRAPKFIKAEGFSAMFKQPFKAAGKAGTIVAALGGVAVLAGHLVAGKLEANENSSVIEHKMDVAHVNN